MEYRLPVALDRYIKTPKVMCHYGLVHEQFKLQVTLYDLKIAICSYTRYDDIMVLVRLLLVDHANEPNYRQPYHTV